MVMVSNLMNMESINIHLCYLTLAGESTFGLVITSLLTILQNWQFFMKLTIEADYLMTSVERIVDYSTLSPEAGFHGLKDSVNSFAGSISFRNVWLRYAEKEPFVIKDLSFSIQEKEKVCIFSLQSKVIALVIIFDDKLRILVP